MAAGGENRICFSDSTDRISELPQPLLQHIICFLSQKEAVQTCVLSKSWRYLGPTRPKLEFLHGDYYDEKTEYRSVLEKTLHRYHDQKLCLQEFHVELSGTNPETLKFFEKLFPLIVATMGGVKTFDLSFRYPGSRYFDLPWELFENSKSLRNLRLCGLRISQNVPTDRAHNLKHLQTLTLSLVRIVDTTFQKLMSSCPHVEHVVLDSCDGLTTIRLMNNSRLKCFELNCFGEYRLNLKEDVCLVDVPNLESLNISSCDNWFSFDSHNRKMHFPGLKSLHLMDLKLPSLDILSRDFPCLQHFLIHDCRGLGQLRVSNRSIKHLTISSLDKSTKVVVDAPNIEVLDYKWSLPMDISIATTTSNEWTSNIRHSIYDVRSQDGFQRLSKLLEAVSHSKIFLHLSHRVVYHDSSDEDDNGCQEDYNDYYYDEGDDNNKPVPVEYMHLDDEYGQGVFYSKAFFNCMFRFCRPRNIVERACTRCSRFLCEMLLFRHNNGIPYFCWQRDLEEASMQVWDQKSEEWLSVEGTAFLESVAHAPNCVHKEQCQVWFKLKWRE